MLGVVGLAWTDGLEVFGRNTAPDLAGRDLRVLKHEGTSGNDTPFADLTAVE